MVHIYVYILILGPDILKFMEPMGHGVVYIWAKPQTFVEDLPRRPANGLHCIDQVLDVWHVDQRARCWLLHLKAMCDWSEVMPRM